MLKIPAFWGESEKCRIRLSAPCLGLKQSSTAKRTNFSRDSVYLIKATLCWLFYNVCIVGKATFVLTRIRVQAAALTLKERGGTVLIILSLSAILKLMGAGWGLRLRSIKGILSRDLTAKFEIRAFTTSTRKRNFSPRSIFLSSYVKNIFFAMPTTEYTYMFHKPDMYNCICSDRLGFYAKIQIIFGTVKDNI